MSENTVNLTQVFSGIEQSPYFTHPFDAELAQRSPQAPQHVLNAHSPGFGIALYPRNRRVRCRRYASWTPNSKPK